MIIPFAQETPAGEELVEEKTLSIIDLLFSGGPGGTIIILILAVLLFLPFTSILNAFLLLKQLQKLIKIS